MLEDLFQIFVFFSEYLNFMLCNFPKTMICLTLMKTLNSCPQHKSKQDRKFRRRKMMRSENSMRRKTAIKNCRQV